MLVGWDLLPYPVLHQFFENGTMPYRSWCKKVFQNVVENHF